MLPSELAEVLASHLGGPIRYAERVGGGCIAHATRVVVNEAEYFLKYGHGAVAQTFGPEAAGLKALREAGSPLAVPQVLAVREETEAHPGFLLLEWIEPGSRPSGYGDALGQGLAALHRHTARRYGFGDDNFIGRTPQRNTWADTWPAFFREHRLGFQAHLARTNGFWQARWSTPFERLLRRLDELLPKAPPASILHGDLWSGNVLATAGGQPALIDPAVYFGHREADLAMTELFGGFSQSFYAAYREAWPLEPGYDERRDVYNLYHLLNHLNLFGGSYAGSVARIIRRFG